MRFVLAISALVLSGVLLILGIGQTTFLAGPRAISHSVQLPGGSNLGVIDAEVLAAVPGQANVVLSGVEPVVAIGKQRDVEAWTAPFGHSLLVLNSEATSLETTRQGADAEAVERYAALIEAEPEDEVAVPSPSGSDLWLDEVTAVPPVDEAGTEEAESAEEAQPAAQTVRMPVKIAGDERVLVAAAHDAPAEVSIEWVQDRRTPWAGPLLAAGGAFALIGAVLYLLAVDHDRRGLGPRRGRKGPLQGIRNMLGASRNRSGSSKRSGGLQRTAATGALGLAAALVLSGCSPSYWPEFSEETAEPEPEVVEEIVTNAAPVPVTSVQVARILSDIAEVSGAADSALDPAGLDARFRGDALAARTANYTIRSAVSDYPVVVPRITDEALGYQLIQSTEGWPRTVFAVVASQSEAEAAGEPEQTEQSDLAEVDDQVDESPSLALIFTQFSPHENFKVSRAVALRGGITMPEAAPAEEGTALLANDSSTFLLPPSQVGVDYAAVLAAGEAAAEAENFDLEGDSLVSRSGASWVAQSTQAAAEAGQGIDYSVSAAQSSTRVISLSTGTGGALIATTVQETRVEAPQEGSRWRPTVNASMAALSGLEGQQEKLVSVVSHQLLFYVPRSDSGEQIQLLGYTSDLIGASNE